MIEAPREGRQLDPGKVVSAGDPLADKTENRIAMSSATSVQQRIAAQPWSLCEFANRSSLTNSSGFAARDARQHSRSSSEPVLTKKSGSPAIDRMKGYWRVRFIVFVVVEAMTALASFNVGVDTVPIRCSTESLG